MDEKNVWNEEKSVVDKISAVTGGDASNITIRNCVVDNIWVGNDSASLVIENCVVRYFSAWGTFFQGPVIIRNSIFTEAFMFSDGGHNKMEIVFENNVFHCYADFFDEVFEAHITLRNNIFLDGTNLFANKGESFEVTFDSGYTVEGNLGKLDFEG